jgi:hypothetical protein
MFLLHLLRETIEEKVDHQSDIKNADNDIDDAEDNV